MKLKRKVIMMTMKYRLPFVLGPALALLAACAQPEPICDRSAQSWSKFGTQEDACELPPATPLPCDCTPHNGGDDPRLVPPVAPPTEPPSEPPVDPTPPGETPHGPTAKGNNGLGNGDQPAPGGSLDNNKAENQKGNPGHKSGKQQKAD